MRCRESMCTKCGVRCAAAAAEDGTRKDIATEEGKDRGTGEGDRIPGKDRHILVDCTMYIRKENIVTQEGND